MDPELKNKNNKMSQDNNQQQRRLDVNQLPNATPEGNYGSSYNKQGVSDIQRGNADAPSNLYSPYSKERTPNHNGQQFQQIQLREQQRPSEIPEDPFNFGDLVKNYQRKQNPSQNSGDQDAYTYGNGSGSRNLPLNYSKQSTQGKQGRDSDSNQMQKMQQKYDGNIQAINIRNENQTPQSTQAYYKSYQTIDERQKVDNNGGAARFSDTTNMNVPRSDNNPFRTSLPGEIKVDYLRPQQVQGLPNKNKQEIGEKQGQETAIYQKQPFSSPKTYLKSPTQDDQALTGLSPKISTNQQQYKHLGTQKSAGNKIEQRQLTVGSSNKGTHTRKSLGNQKDLNDSIINSNSIEDSLSDKVNNIGEQAPIKQTPMNRGATVRVRFGDSAQDDQSPIALEKRQTVIGVERLESSRKQQINTIQQQPIMKTSTVIKVIDEPKYGGQELKPDMNNPLQKALSKKFTKKSSQLSKQLTKKGLSKRHESESIYDEEYQMMENMLNGDSSRFKSTIRGSQQVEAVFKLGSIKDLNISDIDKNDQDDPNQLFSMREAIVDSSPDRDSNQNSKSPDQSKSKTSNLLQVQPSLSKKPISALNTKAGLESKAKQIPQTSSMAVKKVSFTQQVQSTLPSDPSQALLTLMEESEKIATSKRKGSIREGKKYGFGYYSRIFTHYSVNFGIQKLRELKQTELGCFSLIFANSNISALSAQPTTNIQYSKQVGVAGTSNLSQFTRRGSQRHSKISPPPQQQQQNTQARINQTLRKSTMMDKNLKNLGNLKTQQTNQTQQLEMSTLGSSPNKQVQSPQFGFGNVDLNMKIHNKMSSQNNDESQTMNSPKLLKDLQYNTNTSLITLGTDNTEQIVRDPFPLPPMVLTDRSERVMDPILKTLIPKAPKPQNTLTPKAIIPKNGTTTNSSQQDLNKKSTIISFNTGRDDLSLKDVSSQVYLKIKTAPPFSVIKLPERHIILPGLTFSHPITLIGSAATTIEIVNGNILVDFRDYVCSLTESQKNDPSIKVVIQEATLIFKLNSQRMRERLEEYQQKASQIKEEKDTVEQWSDRKLLGADLSIHASFEHDNKIPYSMRGLKYVTLKNNAVMVVPMIVVESETSLEIHDCLIRSSKTDGKDGELSKSGDDRSDWTFKDRSGSFMIGQSKRDSTKRESLLGVDVEDICLWLNGDSISDSCPKGFIQEFSGKALAMSCIFHNFYSVTRAGVNSTLAIQRCVIKETKANSFHIANPKALFLDRNTISNSKKNGILIEWLKGSDQYDMLRNLIIQGNEINSSARDGVAIQSTGPFSAHNLRIQLKANVITKCNGDGISIKNLALTELEISENELIKNQHNGIFLSQVHQKSNKFKFKLWRCFCNDQTTGYGLSLFDTGILVEDSEFKGNEHGGIRIYTNNLKNEKPISEDIKLFLDKFPLVVQIKKCDILENGRSGIQVDDFWKGPILIEDAKIYFNQHSGLMLNSTDYPKDISFFKTFKQGENYPKIQNFYSPQQGSVPRKMNTTVSASNISFGAGRVAPTSLFEDTFKSDKKLPNYQNPFKNRTLGCVYLSQCIITDNKVHGVSVVNVLTDFYNCHISRNLAHAINLQDEENTGFLNLRFNNYRDHLQGTIGGSWGVMNLKFKNTSCMPCGSFCGLGIQSPVFEKKIIQNFKNQSASEKRLENEQQQSIKQRRQSTRSSNNR